MTEAIKKRTLPHAAKIILRQVHQWPHSICTSFHMYLIPYVPHSICTSFHMYLIPYVPHSICTSFHMYFIPYVPHYVACHIPFSFPIEREASCHISFANSMHAISHSDIACFTFCFECV